MVAGANACLVLAWVTPSSLALQSLPHPQSRCRSLASAPRLRAPRLRSRAELEQDDPPFTASATIDLAADSSFFEWPRDAVSLGYLGFGGVFTGLNVAGIYDSYDAVVTVALVLGTISAIAMSVDAVDPPSSYVDAAKGYVNRSTISRFGAAYMWAAMWVCFRTGPVCAGLLPPAELAADPLLRGVDGTICLLAAAVFLWGVWAPLSEEVDAAGDREPLTDVQTLLLRGSIAQNIIGATFLPVVISMAFRGPLWWAAVHEHWPMQQLLEPSTSTFAGLSVDAGLLFLRIAARRKMTWEQVVLYGVSSSVVFAVVPCVAFLVYNDGKFDWFSLYSIPRTW